MKDINTDTQMIHTVHHRSRYPKCYPADGAKTCWLLEMFCTLNHFITVIPVAKLFYKQPTNSVSGI